ncbi:MAG: GNAT family N-acetyltransferase [Bacteroidota bacterium]
MYLFQSERLGFRTWQKSDLDTYAAMNADPDVMEFFPSLLSREVSKKSIENFEKHYEEHGFNFFPVDTLSENRFIGFIGMKRVGFEAFFTPCVEIGWRLDKAYWGKGYATEGALRCLKFAFEELGEEAVYSFTALQNKRSERVMQKIGMHKAGEFDHPKLSEDSELRQHVLYKIERPKG